MKSRSYFGDGAVESCATTKQDQSFAEKCGRNGALETQRELAAPPVPRVVATCPKGSRQEFRLILKRFNGNRAFELVVFEKNGLGEFVETPRRIAVAPKFLRGLIGVFEQGERVAFDEGLIP